MSELGKEKKMESRYLAEDGPKNKHLVIQLSEYENNRFLDLRYFYFDKKDQEYKPTRKGISLTRSNYLMVKKVVEKNHEQVMDWLGVGYVPEHVEKYQHDQEAQADKIRSKVLGNIELYFEEEKRDPSFFRVEYLGGANRLYINTGHVKGKEIQDLVQSDKINEFVLRLLVDILFTYAKSRDGLKDTSSIDPEVLFDQLEYDWSNFLKNED